ncbi:MAG: hypothetical protein HYU55_19090, partial [Nocardioides sp.]|nr:hypothetical protein [Nocardioides sp.]
MRRTTTAVTATAALAAALTFGTAYATQTGSDSDDASATTTSSSPVLNKNGHEVNEHAAFGQARAAEARAQHEATETPTSEPSE